MAAGSVERSYPTVQSDTPSLGSTQLEPGLVNWKVQLPYGLTASHMADAVADT
jgi:hypothetical protein